MKKILFLLLLTVSSYGQTLQNPTFGNTTTNTLKIKTNTESATATKINAQEADGKINYIQSINIPVPYIPTNYSPTTQTLKGQLEGINTKLGAAQTTDLVLNKSSVSGITATDAFNLLNNSKLSGSGTATFIPKFTSTSSLGNSILYDTGTQIGLGTSNPMQTLHIASSINNGYLKITTSTTGSSLSDGSNIGVNSLQELDVANLENTNINFYTNNLFRSRITNAGRHLLGTTTDNLKDILQVSGTISYLGLSFTSVTTGSPDIIFSTVPLGSQKTIGTINVDAGYGVADAILESYTYTTSGYGMQRITYTSGSLANRVFVRSLSVGIWTSWVEISSAPVSGTYTPIISGIANTTTAGLAGNPTYIRVGNVVTVTVGIQTTVPAITTQSQITITLPINRTITTTQYAGSGSLTNNSSPPSTLTANIPAGVTINSGSTTTATCYFNPTSTLNTWIGSVTFQYSIN